MPTQNVNLTQQQADFIRERIAAGDYQSVSEVVRAGLRLLKERDDAQEAKLKWLRGEIQKGLDDIEAGRYVELNTEEDYRAFREELTREGRKRLALEQRNVEIGST